MRLISILAEAPAEAKGIAGIIASVSLPGWASIAASAATAIYMLRKTYLLNRAPACPICGRAPAKCTCD